MTLVSLFTDAAVGNDGAAGWGYWAKASPKRQSEGGGPLAGRYVGSVRAEFAAIANSLQAAINAGVIQRGDRVLIQTDNMACVHILTGKRRRRLPDNMQPIKEKIVAVATKAELTILCKHIRAHKKVSERDRRHHVNETCDRLAKAGKRKARHSAAPCPNQDGNHERTAPTDDTARSCRTGTAGDRTRS